MSIEWGCNKSNVLPQSNKLLTILQMSKWDSMVNGLFGRIEVQCSTQHQMYLPNIDQSDNGAMEVIRYQVYWLMYEPLVGTEKKRNFPKESNYYSFCSSYSNNCVGYFFKTTDGGLDDNRKLEIMLIPKSTCSILTKKNRGKNWLK